MIIMFTQLVLYLHISGLRDFHWETWWIWIDTSYRSDVSRFLKTTTKQKAPKLCVYLMGYFEY